MENGVGVTYFYTQSYVSSLTLWGVPYTHTDWRSLPKRRFYVMLFMLTCFFFCASLLSTAGVETSKDFCAAFKAAGLYTVFVRPVDVDNTYQHKFNFFRVLLFIIS